jgi:hypothetical protein
LLREKENISAQEIIQRYPELVSHMICESLGYFTPEAAARAIQNYIKKEPCYCEWYMHMESISGKNLLDINARVIRDSFVNRHYHQGYMSDYGQARAIVERVRKGGESPIFASWF